MQSLVATHAATDEYEPNEHEPDEYEPDEYEPDEYEPDEYEPDEYEYEHEHEHESNSPLATSKLWRVQLRGPPTNNQQPTTNNQQPTTNNQQPTTNNQQPTTMFSFRFASLLRLRENERDAARQEIADAMRALGILEDQRTELLDQREQLRAAAQRQLSGKGLSVDAMLSSGRYDVQLAAEIQSLEGNIAAVEVEVQRRQDRLKEADIEVKRLERLREQQHTQWQQQQLAAQQIELDEIASMRAVRNHRHIRTASPPSSSSGA
ncbi:flagellar export protein FliJ [Roseimaritima sediminicola]|uniref:flagellar export protein FliJ n=1 Tax=Roseimaritima sediminicola TaxID=2662066 RepID=UPI001386E2BE|nr:flagellar export protein FliJ [Roseimaritima sediminicola]